MPTFNVTLKRTILAVVKVEAATAEEARQMFAEEDARWMAFNAEAEQHHGEETRLVKVQRAKPQERA